ncbi:fused MFS/spermidine synthase [Fontisphaera persica]|uniref:fused MFS/spermidine synthase n=1 Tax=Fontisphaera persica TaxID=2974023 RepID=UPI0024C020DC|nr:fused MFS/spermidine synthase [Fontisphaera persica]WCJ59041.1 fused MFS/spermidine synthase [Fontisphaera persica]
MKKNPVPVEPAADAPPPAAAGGGATRLRRYLYFTAAFTGAAILIVEILGAKMLSPYFGTSHFVWTAQITVTLISLAAGYYLGGWLADRSPDLRRMYLAILAAAIYLAISVPLCAPVSFACLKQKLAVGSLLASLFLFFPPLTLLAVVGPFLVRNFTHNLQTVGGQVGRVSALSTLGSVAGTLLIGYAVIPYLPNSLSMYLTAVGLMVVSLVYFFLLNPRPLRASAQVSLVAALLTGLGAGYSGIRQELALNIPGYEELERRNSNFGQMLVIQHTNLPHRVYLNDWLTQNTYDPLEKKSTSMFTWMLHGLARAYTPKIERALCIGLGVGIVPMQLARDGAQVDVVEINPEMPGLAQRHFDFDPTRARVFIDDGRHFLNAAARPDGPRYDTIILDAFLGDSSPSHLMSREAFVAMQKILRPGGTVVINSFGELDPARNFFTASLECTLQAVFKSVRIHTAFGGNVLLVASDIPDLAFVRQPDLSEVHPRALGATRLAMENVVTAPPSKHRIRVLTDDFNPVEFYDAVNREMFRRNMVQGMMQGYGY